MQSLIYSHETISTGGVFMQRCENNSAACEGKRSHSSRSVQYYDQAYITLGNRRPSNARGKEEEREFIRIIRLC